MQPFISRASCQYGQHRFDVMIIAAGPEGFVAAVDGALAMALKSARSALGQNTLLQTVFRQASGMAEASAQQPLLGEIVALDWNGRDRFNMLVHHVEQGSWRRSGANHDGDSLHVLGQA
jgi:hypothetical protein